MPTIQPSVAFPLSPTRQPLQLESQGKLHGLPGISPGRRTSSGSQTTHAVGRAVSGAIEADYVSTARCLRASVLLSQSFKMILKNNLTSFDVLQRLCECLSLVRTCVCACACANGLGDSLGMCISKGKCNESSW